MAQLWPNCCKKLQPMATRYSKEVFEFIGMSSDFFDDFVIQNPPPARVCGFNSHLRYQV